jgi:hypothetical protein
VISRSYTKGSVSNDKGGFSSHLISDEITMCEYRTQTSVECKTIINDVLLVMSVWDPLKISGLWHGFE